MLPRGATASARLVRRERPRPAVAAHARPVRDPRLGGHAPADAGGARGAPLHRRGSSAGRRSPRSPRRSPADVIRAWQGLGYNRRALNLHRAARARRGARLAGRPDRAARRRPLHRRRGRGLRVRAPVLPVDVNVRRVIERSGGDFDHRAAQALFDLGATVCLARIPRCGACPLAAGCPSRGRRWRARAQAGAAGGLVPAAEGTDAAARGRRGAPPARVGRRGGQVPGARRPRGRRRHICRLARLLTPFAPWKQRSRLRASRSSPSSSTARRRSTGSTSWPARSPPPARGSQSSRRRSSLRTRRPRGRRRSPAGPTRGRRRRSRCWRASRSQCRARLPTGSARSRRATGSGSSRA